MYETKNFPKTILYQIYYLVNYIKYTYYAYARILLQNVVPVGFFFYSKRYLCGLTAAQGN